MKRFLKWTLVLIAVLLIGIQFARPTANISGGADAQGIEKQYQVPEKVLALLQRSCYDCHSNNTHYPWYNNIQPVAWYLADHIEEGKRELNFSTFATYSPKKAAHKLDEIVTETGEHEMPISSYTNIHRSTTLSDEEIELISGWASVLSDSIRVANHLPEAH